MNENDQNVKKDFFKIGDTVVEIEENCENQPMVVKDIIWQKDRTGRPKFESFIRKDGKIGVRHFIKGILCEFTNDIGSKSEVQYHSHNLKKCD